MCTTCVSGVDVCSLQSIMVSLVSCEGNFDLDLRHYRGMPSDCFKRSNPLIAKYGLDRNTEAKCAPSTVLPSACRA